MIQKFTRRLLLPFNVACDILLLLFHTKGKRIKGPTGWLLIKKLLIFYRSFFESAYAITCETKNKDKRHRERCIKGKSLRGQILYHYLIFSRIISRSVDEQKVISHSVEELTVGKIGIYRSLATLSEKEPLAQRAQAS